jgi:enoyl-CoA hydratase/carnithine racemase
MSASDTAQAGVVLYELRGSVALITLNRPDRLNAWSDELESEYFRLLADADADPAVRAIVVTGAGRGWCAGRDMDDLEREARSGSGPEVPEAVERTYPLTIRKPLIAAINGAAAGLGLVEALYCDVRFCVPGAKLTTAFARRGLIAEYGLAWLLPRLIGLSRSLDLLLSGRVVLGDEAYRIGLVDHLAEPDRLVDEALAYATDLAENCSPASMQIMKEQVHRGLDTDFSTGLADAARLLEESFARPDVVEGVSSYVERRAPDFAPLPPRH